MNQELQQELDILTYQYRQDCLMAMTRTLKREAQLILSRIPDTVQVHFDATGEATVAGEEALCLWGPMEALRRKVAESLPAMTRMAPEGWTFSLQGTQPQAPVLQWQKKVL